MHAIMHKFVFIFEKINNNKFIRYISGGGAPGAMTSNELNVLEKHLETWIYQVRSAKVYFYTHKWNFISYFISSLHVIEYKYHHTICERVLMK